MWLVMLLVNLLKTKTLLLAAYSVARVLTFFSFALVTPSLRLYLRGHNEDQNLKEIILLEILCATLKRSQMKKF